MRLRTADRLILYLLAAIIVSTIAPAILAEPRANKQYCNPDGTNFVLAIDTTTPYDDRDKDELVRGVEEIGELVRGGDRLVIRTITESFVTSDHIFDRCLPYCADDTFLGRLFYCKGEGQIASDTRQFKREASRSLRARLADFTGQPHSDIIHTIANLSREEISPGRQSVLYVFSDLLENSDHASPNKLNTLSVKALIDVVKRKALIASLVGVEVHVFGVGRDDSPKRAPLTTDRYRKLLEFWNAYFKASGAHPIEILPNLVPPPTSTSGFNRR